MLVPKVSCILPCGYGEEFIGTALACFGGQVYPGALELVVVDNNETPLLTKKQINKMGKDFVYIRSERLSIGALRNLGTSRATGQVCISWDEDDWCHPNRITAQVNRLITSRKAVTGWHDILYYDTTTGGTYKYRYSPGVNHPPYAMGTSQCYWRDWWEKYPFPETGVEDLPFSDNALHRGELDSCDAGQLAVALVHKQNCSRQGQLGRHKQWPAVERSAFPPEFFAAVEAQIKEH